MHNWANGVAGSKKEIGYVNTSVVICIANKYTILVKIAEWCNSLIDGIGNSFAINYRVFSVSFT